MAKSRARKSRPPKCIKSSNLRELEVRKICFANKYFECDRTRVYNFYFICGRRQTGTAEKVTMSRHTSKANWFDNFQSSPLLFCLRAGLVRHGRPPTILTNNRSQFYSSNLFFSLFFINRNLQNEIPLLFWMKVTEERHQKVDSHRESGETSVLCQFCHIAGKKKSTESPRISWKQSESALA